MALILWLIPSATELHILFYCLQTPWQPGTEVVALYKFVGNSSDDLPFKRGDILTIVRATAVSCITFVEG
jgi:SH3 domain